MSQRPSPLLLSALYFGFMLTGIGTTLLGCALPALSTDWRLTDSSAGLLFAAQFVGSSSGALLVQSRLDSSILRGYSLIIAGGILISLLRGHLAPLFFVVFGLGLGQAMTATSMTFGRIYSSSRGASLSLLNAAWGFGAVICPWIASFWARFRPSDWLFLGIALASLPPFFYLVLHRDSLATHAEEAAQSTSRQADLSLLIPLAAFAFLYVGVESSVGGWMMTYIHRLPVSGEVLAPVITSLFWIALLCGRTAAPAVLKRMTEPGLLTASLLVALASTGLLLLSHTSFSSLACATLIGLTLAPVFPLCISRLLGLTDKPSQSRWVFALSGLGGAVLPWMTGQLASFQGSLRVGLLVPLFGTAIMLLLHLRTRPSAQTS
ncbi:MAG TPA: MFS transporter [Pseudacidobacterium sp.]|nr:MFS transporter [Pseudacidobacterium sp.]